MLNWCCCIRFAQPWKTTRTRVRESSRVMQADDEEEQDFKPSPQKEGPLPLVDELGVEDLQDPIFGGRGRLFSTAGRDSPVAEFTKDFLVLHPPQLPFEESGQGESEDIVINVDESGILLDELGRQKKI